MTTQFQRRFLASLTTSAALASSAACSFGMPQGGYVQPMQVVTQAPPQQTDALAPLTTCANQRGLATERFGELLQVRLDQETLLEYHYDNNRNLVMGARFLQPLPPVARAERSEMAHVRGNEIYACAGYGTPVYLGASEPAAAPPQVYAAQPQPQYVGQPQYAPQPYAERPMCARLDTCVDEVAREACPPNDGRCFEGFRMREAQDNDCRQGLDRVRMRLEQMRREHPNLRLPEACLAPNGNFAPPPAMGGGAPPPPVGHNNAPPPPSMGHNEPMQPAGAMGPACGQLQNCYRDMTAEACRMRKPQCESAYPMRERNEKACELALRELLNRMEEIRRSNPGFVMPGSCQRR